MQIYLNVARVEGISIRRYVYTNEYFNILRILLQPAVVLKYLSHSIASSFFLNAE